MRVWQEELLGDVKDGEEGSKLVLEARSGGSGSSVGLFLISRHTGWIWIHAGGAGTRGRRDEGQYRPEELWETAEKASRPVRVAKERTCGQHGVRKHSWGLKIKIIKSS